MTNDFQTIKCLENNAPSINPIEFITNLGRSGFSQMNSGLEFNNMTWDQNQEVTHYL